MKNKKEEESCVGNIMVKTWDFRTGWVNRNFLTYKIYTVKMSKTFKHLKEKICSLPNLIEADKKARKGKEKTLSMVNLDKNYLNGLLQLQKELLDGTYRTSKYRTFTIYEPKEREIFALPYYPDRIVHHAVMNILEPIWKKIFVKNTYSSIKGRGIHAAMKDVKTCLKGFRHRNQPAYFLKLDIRKFYPSVDHDILKRIIRKSIGDKWLLWLLDEIIDSAEGLPIGNYLSQYFANLYLTYFDHYLLEEARVKHYFRYCDDMVIIADNKEVLHHYLEVITKYLAEKLYLTVKHNHRIAPVKEGIDFTGYVMTAWYTKLRKSIKCKMMRKGVKLAKKVNAGKISIPKYYEALGTYEGWLKYANTKRLRWKLLFDPIL